VRASAAFPAKERAAAMRHAAKDKKREQTAGIEVAKR
jgi:hypothetical protein